jgi:hypothetical protein
MMDKHIFARFLGDETKAFFIVEPLDFAAGHMLLLKIGPDCCQKQKRHAPAFPANVLLQLKEAFMHFWVAAY